MNNLLYTRKKTIHFTKKTQPKKLKWWHKLLFLSPIILIALLFKANDWYESYLLNHYKDSTWAVIIKANLAGARDVFDVENVAYQYKANDSVYTAYTSIPVNHRFVIGKLGIPVFPDQRYKVYYVPHKPHICRLDITQPDSATIQLFIRNAALNVRSILNELSMQQAICMAEKIYQTFGYDGLAYLFFYDEYVVENITHNNKTFNNFWNTTKVQKIIKNCKSSP